MGMQGWRERLCVCVKVKAQSGRSAGASRALGLVITITIMYSIHNLRPLLRATVLRPSVPRAHLTPLVPLRPYPSHIVKITNGFQQHRAVASQVSGRPGSQTISQAAVNVREEVGNSTTDWAKVIAGGNSSGDSVKPDRETFVSESWNSEAIG